VWGGMNAPEVLATESGESGLSRPQIAPIFACQADCSSGTRLVVVGPTIFGSMVVLSIEKPEIAPF